MLRVVGECLFGGCSTLDKEGKTEYLVPSKAVQDEDPLEARDLSFKNVPEFRHLWSTVKRDSGNSGETSGTGGWILSADAYLLGLIIRRSGDLPVSLLLRA